MIAAIQPTLTGVGRTLIFEDGSLQESRSFLDYPFSGQSLLVRFFASFFRSRTTGDFS